MRAGGSVCWVSKTTVETSTLDRQAVCSRVKERRWGGSAGGSVDGSSRTRSMWAYYRRRGVKGVVGMAGRGDEGVCYALGDRGQGKGVWQDTGARVAVGREGSAQCSVAGLSLVLLGVVSGFGEG